MTDPLVAAIFDITDRRQAMPTYDRVSILAAELVVRERATRTKFASDARMLTRVADDIHRLLDVNESATNA